MLIYLCRGRKKKNLPKAPSLERRNTKGFGYSILCSLTKNTEKGVLMNNRCSFKQSHIARVAMVLYLGDVVRGFNPSLSCEEVNERISKLIELTDDAKPL